ncbi:MAG: hypothetical protein HY202_05050 [Nitrospirae bacterium]|nr:hypothetical protein [Nitrospirota bacterium]MBI3605376.1 hypothetical protein [Nitrospirota bacterium]
MKYFDYSKVAKEAHIPADKLEELKRIVREDFPHDDMMFELHLLRACRAIQEGVVSIEDAIHPKAGTKH